MKRKNMTDFRAIIQRLRAGESQRQIHRSTKVHRTLIRATQQIAEKYGWLSKDIPIPADYEIFKVINQNYSNNTHPLQAFDVEFERWLSEDMDVTVMHRLLGEKCPCSISTLRRYLKQRFPAQIKPVMIRQTIPGKYMDVDFGELGIFLDEKNIMRKVWVFSGRLRHSRKAFREIVLNQKLDFVQF
jgi:hypothetical protein